MLLYKGFLLSSCEEGGGDIIHFYSGRFFYFLNLDFGDEQCWFFNLFNLKLFIIIYFLSLIGDNFVLKMP